MRRRVTVGRVLAASFGGRHARHRGATVGKAAGEWTDTPVRWLVWGAWYGVVLWLAAWAGTVVGRRD